MTRRAFAAVDLGASSGRVVAGIVDDGAVSLDVVHRFPNAARRVDGHLRWDLTSLHDEILDGLATLAGRYPETESVGIDTWGVDYALLDEQGSVIADPIAYRDDRTAAAVVETHARVSREELYRRTGVQFLPINTIYQLVADRATPAWERAAHVALLPDVLAYLLTGELRTEYTIATTTGLVDIETRDWSPEILTAIGVDRAMLPAIEQPGRVLGTLRSEVARRTAMSSQAVVTTVAGHDTASAVVGVPALDDHFAYISSGTWSLVGVEAHQPVVTDAARQANFTNEGGVDGTTRFLRNVGGLWVLQECERAWSDAGTPPDLAVLVAEAAQLDSNVTFDVDAPELFAPGDMPVRLADLIAANGGTPPDRPAAFVRCIVDSLADAYAATVSRAEQLSGQTVDVVHLVGGGARNDLLCRMTATRLGRPVIAGPAEATALGNILVQARTHGALTGGLPMLRAHVAPQCVLHRFEPAAAKATP